MAGYQPGGGFGGPTTTVEISVACQKLCDKDVLSKSDPLCVMYEKSASGTWNELGRTEMLTDNLNPSWRKKFVVDYKFEQRQLVKFEVYDWDSKSSKVKDHDFLGSLECTLAQIVAAPNKQFNAAIKEGPSKGGKFFISAEELSGNKDILTIQFGAKGLDKKDTFGKSDPYLVISKISPGGAYSVVHRSEMIKNTLNPDWQQFKINVSELCNADYGRQLKFDVFDWDSNGEHDLIGSFNTNLAGLQKAAVEKSNFAVINPKKQSKKSYKNSGEVFVKNLHIEAVASFMDFIQGGTTMNFSVAIDFTLSNGDPKDPRSLHFLDQSTWENQYTQAIKAVGEIIEDYDFDKQFPALGFGGRVPPAGEVSHEFFLNLQDNPFCNGVQGILQAYFHSLHQVQLYGPTNFSPVMNHVAQFAKAYQDGKQYFVLLIITDGIITDLEETKAAIVAASSLPMSIIIVGVGEEDFSTMEVLDSDKGMLRAQGRVAARDIVQFVEMRKFVKGGSWSKDLLANSVLAEVPRQLVNWMNKNGIKPNTK